MKRSLEAALEPEGAEYEALAALAQKHDLFLAGNAYETDRHFPGLYFQASFVIDPAGSTVLRYRRLVSLFAPTPHDVWDRYLDIYGLEGVFPVARKSIQRSCHFTVVSPSRSIWTGERPSAWIA